MANQKSPNLPDHLIPLLQPTPSGIAKLIAAWEGLTTESQIRILAELGAGLKKWQGSGYLIKKVLTKALESANPYVRYLAARRFHPAGKDSSFVMDTFNLISTNRYPLDDESKKRIEADPDPLVRYSLLESEYAGFNPFLDNPDEFFNLPQEARLALVRRLAGHGKQVAALISYVVDHQLKNGVVSELDLFEILLDYVNRAEFKNYYKDDIENPSSDGWKEYDMGEDIDGLWRLVLKLPESLSHILIETLPPGGGMNPDIPDEVLQNMSDQQLVTLLYRQDIELPELRKKLFFEANEKRYQVKDAAGYRHFDLEYREFTEILAKPDEERVKILEDLARGASDLRLCFYATLRGALFSANDFDAAEFAAHALQRKLSRLTGGQRKTQKIEVQLYHLAEAAVPWRKDKESHLPWGELKFFTKAIVEGDTWATFIAFLEEWQNNRGRADRLEKHLASCYPIDDEDLAWDVQIDNSDDATQSLDKFICLAENKLSEILSTLAAVDTSVKIEVQGISQHLGRVVKAIEEMDTRQRQEREEQQRDRETWPYFVAYFVAYAAVYAFVIGAAYWIWPYLGNAN